MAKVTIHKKEDLEKALRHFKVRCKREGIFQECKERKHYIKPSLKKRRAFKKKSQ